MGRVVYSLNVSLDGYVETPEHSLEWANVDEELHRWFNAAAERSEVFVYGRRMYELMAAYWPYGEDDPEATPAMVEFSQIWKPKPKVVLSATLDAVDWNSRLVREDAAAEVARLRAATDGDIGVCGATLAGSLIRAGLVDEFRMAVHPVVIGQGTPFFPALDRHLALQLRDARRLDSGVELLTYATDRAG